MLLLAIYRALRLLVGKFCGVEMDDYTDLTTDYLGDFERFILDDARQTSSRNPNNIIAKR